MLSIFAVFVRYRQPLTRIANILAILLLFAYIVRAATTPPRTIQLDPITKVIEVPVEKLTTKTVTQYVRVQDRAAVDRLMKDNAALNSTVQQLTVSLAAATSQGTGPVIVTPPSADTPPTIIEVPMALKFKDWRLDFQSDGTTANYTLSQKFSIINTVGRNENNVPVNIVRLFEIDDKGQRIPIPTIETTTISTQPTRQHFYIKPTLQSGIGILPRWETTTTPYTTGGRTTYDTAVVVSMPWWKRGATTAVENTRYAYLTPTITISDTEFTAGVMPISVNFGTFKHVPLSDIWAGSYFGISSKNSAKKFGIVFTTTF